jgi:hypothetical protein
VAAQESRGRVLPSSTRPSPVAAGRRMVDAMNAIAPGVGLLILAAVLPHPRSRRAEAWINLPNGVEPWQASSAVPPCCLPPRPRSPSLSPMVVACAARKG